MNRLLYILQFLAAVTLCTAHNMFKRGGLATVPLAFAVTGDDDDFEKEVLTGFKTMKKSQEELTTKFDNLDKETKKAFEELTKVKNNLNSISEFEQKLAKVNVLLRREQRAAYDPIKRIEMDDELRTRINVAVRLASKDPAIRQMGEEMGKSLTKRTLYSEATPGSTFITADLASEIYDTLASYGVWRTFGVQRVGTKTTKFPVSTARPVALAVRKLSNRKLAEDATIAGTSVDCDVVLWGVLLGVERELLEDAEYDVTSYVLENFAEAMAFRLDHLCLTADGGNDEFDSDISGVLTTGTAATATAGNTSIATLELEDFVNCLTTVDEGVLNRPTRWWAHPRNIARFALVRDDNNRPIFQTALEMPTAGIGSILGSPVTPANVMPSTNAAGDKVAVFGDPRGHVLGLRTDVGFDTSDDFAFDGVKRMFRGLARAGAKTRKAGAFAVLTLPAS